MKRVRKIKNLMKSVTFNPHGTKESSFGLCNNVKGLSNIDRIVEIS